jgi:hypothetical protein
MIEGKEKQFEAFFADRSNVNMSSYKVDAKTNMPILYLRDQKSELWNKFSQEYPDGMKKTSFMARLENGPFKYREDLGGLCSICNTYGYQIFEDLLALVKSDIMDKNMQVSLSSLLNNYSKSYIIIFYLESIHS